jgi:hypothetical protein
MDLKNILDESEKINLKKNPNVKVYKKPIQLKDIENRSKTNLNGIKDNNDISDCDINKLIDLEKDKIYQQTWTKLDNGSKLTKLQEYSIKLSVEHELNDNQKNKLMKLLINACNKGKLNKISEVEYDKDNCKITNIKILIFNSDLKTFSLKISENKSKSKNSSKSNIERLLKN